MIIRIKIGDIYVILIISMFSTNLAALALICFNNGHSSDVFLSSETKIYRKQNKEATRMLFYLVVIIFIPIFEVFHYSSSMRTKVS
jgi:hypothetical protein